jgi:hypothetical protein
MANLKTTTIDGSLIGNSEEGSISDSTLTINLATGNLFEVNFADVGWPQNTIDTFTISGYHASHVSSFKLVIINDDPPRQFDWSSLSTFKWPGGTGPTITGGGAAGQDKRDILQFTTWDAGSTWYGRVIGQNFS